MDWTDLAVTLPVERVEEAAAIAQLAAGGGIYIEDYSDLEEQTKKIAHVDLIDEELVKKDRTKAVLHIYVAPGQSPAETAAFLEQRLSACGIGYSLSFTGVREEDWSTAWKSYYHPIELSDRIAICPTWEEYEARPGQQVIRLDPGMAFGTGTHETTRLCLALLEEYLKPGMSMLDVGCGSGILAICAGLLGSGRTVGVDIDPVAVRTAKENAAFNGCGEIGFFCGDLARDVAGPFDVICANIVADAILRLAGDLPRLMAEGGVCVVSGIIDTRKDEVLAGLRAAGLVPVALREESGWVAVACEKAPKTR